MGESYVATLHFWPASPLPGSVAHQLSLLGVDLKELQAVNGVLTPYRTHDGGLGLEITLYDSYYRLTGVEGVLAILRLAGIHYSAWDCDGAGRSFDPASGEEQAFAVLTDGEPVITAPELDALGRYGSAEAVLEQLRRKLARTTPPFTETLAPEQVTLLVRDDDLIDDETGSVIDMEDR